MRRFCILSPQILLLSIILIFSANSFAAVPTTHFIDFGGAKGYTYYPNLLTFEIGDTVIFRGDFIAYPLVSTSVPSGADPISVNSGNLFRYIVEIPGTYTYQNTTYSVIGMKGSFTGVALPHGSLTNEGREFYLGLLYPSYYSVSLSAQGALKAYAMVTSFYDNVISLSYYDESGAEHFSPIMHVAAGHSLQIPLDVNSMRIDESPEIPAYKACHIKAKYPIAVEYLSAGVNSGGSYLALPVLGLGKNYVIASYNDNPGGGALYDAVNGGYYYPRAFEFAGGEFIIIATDDGTSVKITPNATTSGGHTGAHTGPGSNGTPRPYNIGLSKGQCYFVRSNGKDVGQDISGSLVEASKPVVVISGHEDANLGGVDASFMEARDFMIEQMTPVEYWDTTGFLSVPLVEASPPGTDGHGDNYRVFTFDGAAKVTADVVGIGSGYQMNTSRLASPPPEILDVTTPVDIYSTNGRKISVMLYDERSQPMTAPWTAPSMMTIVPHSKWRTSYDFSVLLPAGSGLGGAATPNQFMDVISDSGIITVSVDGSKEKNLSSSFSTAGNFGVISNHSSAKATRYRIGPGAYHLHSNNPFIVYRYGMNEVNPWGSPGLGTYLNYETEYASPGGMQLNTGANPAFSIVVTVPNPCSGWHICIQDTGANDPGIKAVVIANDSAGLFYGKPGLRSVNVALDSSSGDYEDGELHPHWHSNNAYCFDVLIANPAAQTQAAISIIDNNGNGLLLNLHHDPPALTFATSPVRTTRPDSIYIPPQKIGTSICTTFVFKNVGPAKSIPVSFISARFSHQDSAFSIGTIAPAIPCTIKPGDSLSVEVCYSAQDSNRHKDSLVVSSDCIFELIAFNARSVTGLIQADNINFGPVEESTEYCKTVLIENTGSAVFTLAKSFYLSDTVNFSIDPHAFALLPTAVLPGRAASLNICYHPKAPSDSLRMDSARLNWNTDLEPAFAGTYKNYSILTGSVIKKVTESSVAKVLRENTLSVHPNPVNGNSVIITFGRTDFSQSEGSLSIFDVLGREVFHQEVLLDISQIEIPVRDFARGVYYIRLSSKNGTLTEKMEVVRQ